MKEHVNYGVEAVDKISPLNNQWYGWIHWFDGQEIVATESGGFSNPSDAWVWVADKLKEFSKEVI